MATNTGVSPKPILKALVKTPKSIGKMIKRRGSSKVKSSDRILGESGYGYTQFPSKRTSSLQLASINV